MATHTDQDDSHSRRKLLTGSDVEVFESEGALKGSWHKATVVNHAESNRTVIMHDSNSVRSISVSYAIDGYLLNRHSQRTVRSSIRPVPCRKPVQQHEASFGTCVDVLIQNAYFEGVITDHGTVLLPDLGNIETVPLNTLSHSLDWNEVNGEWTPRGKWKFLEALVENKGCDELSIPIWNLWCEVKTSIYFVINIGAWHHANRTQWDFLVSNVLKGLVPLRATQFHKANISNVSTVDLVDNEGTYGSGAQKAVWKPVKLKPEYSDEVEQHGLDGPVEKDAIRKHLLSLGWVVERKTDQVIRYRMERKTDQLIIRYRYRPPNANGFYYSLKKIPAKLVHGSKENQVRIEVESDQLSPNGDDELGPNRQDDLGPIGEDDLVPNGEHKLAPNGDDELGANIQGDLGPIGEDDLVPNGEHKLAPNGEDFEIEPKYLPEAIDEYINFVENRLKSGKRKNISTSQLRLNVKKHLLFVGWTLRVRSANTTQPRLLYQSPAGKNFQSLVIACKAYLNDQSRAGGTSSVPVLAPHEDETENNLMYQTKRKFDYDVSVENSQFTSDFEFDIENWVNVNSSVW